jgi:hypothetical protein
VVVKANIDRGTVLIDDEAKGNLASGTLTLSGVPEGRHTLAIEAKDYQRYETSITVRTGETVPHNATLAEMSKLPPTPSPEPISIEGTVAKSGFNVWKPVFFGAVAVDAALLGYTLYEYSLSTNRASHVKTPRMSGGSLSNSDCGSKAMYSDDFQKACKFYDNYTVGWIVSSVVGAAVVGTLYMAFFRNREHSDAPAANRGHKKRRELAITPIVTPDGGGATLRIDW